ncbi:methionyl-tRNA formyltransferase [Sulfurimonas sp.]|nr:methionyl-tRNA formyltransferase [Sulfurimonas sp.]
MDNIIVATIKEWNISNYFKLKELYKDRYKFHLITNKDELTAEYVNELNPKYIFFPHWSWIILKELYDSYECIVFHMTDLPYGRGGSPFQNLIIREVYDTKISALKVDDGLDAGDIYLKENFNISKGSAGENMTKISSVIFEKMIPKFLDSELVAKKQVGDVVNFKRRSPKDSDINTLENKSINKLYDFIRMLDADGYPKAYLEIDGLKIEFSDVDVKDDKLSGRIEVIKNV